MMRFSAGFRVLALVVGLWLSALSGCRSQQAEGPDYSRPLQPGAVALRKIDAQQWPAFEASIATAMSDPHFREASARSVKWFSYPSSRGHFPRANITYDRAYLSTMALHQILEEAHGHPASAMQRIREEFDLYMSVGWDGKGTVLFTGYYAPIFQASLEPDHRFRYPLYRLPESLVRPDHPGMAVRWRTPDGRLVDPPTRRDLERGGLLRGQEIVYLADPLDAYLIHVQGSARLDLTNGRTLYVGYAADNGYDYTSLGYELIQDGHLKENQAGLPEIRAFFRAHPHRLAEYTQRNDRFIFFQEYDSQVWPAGSLGFRVAPWRSLATDKAIFPRAMPVLVDTQAPGPISGTRELRQLMFDQDTGGAIRAPGRGDIFMGIGPDAEAVAGRQKHEGRMYYLVLKPERKSHWQQMLGSVPR